MTYLAAVVILQRDACSRAIATVLFYFQPYSSRVFPWRSDCFAQASRLLRHFICRLWPAALVAGRHAVRDHRRDHPHAKYFVEQCRARDPESSPRKIAHTQRHRSRIVRPPGRAHLFLRLLPAKSQETEGFCALLASGISRLAGQNVSRSDRGPPRAAPWRSRRILERHQLAGPQHSYEYVRLFFERSLPPDVPLYNEFHALIVQTGKDYCRARNPRCDQCPLHGFLPERTPAAS